VRRQGPLGALAVCVALALPAAAGAAECAGDECQGPPPAPEEVIPGTAVVQAPPNPPVRFPTNHHKKPHGKKHPGHKRSHRGRR
jgi:hypothetical protein